jgi:hypothetical protein
MLAFNAAAHAATTADTTQANIASRMQGLNRFYTSHSLDDLHSTVYTLVSSLNFGTIKPQDYVARRREIVQAWATVLAAIQAAYPKNFDPNNMNDLPTDCVMPPGGNYPCGVRPSDISDAAVRAHYVSAIATNQAKLQRVQLYHQVQVLDMVAMAGLEVNLREFRERRAPPDTAALDDILRDAGLTHARIVRVRSMY